jgi:hypothetical protein
VNFHSEGMNLINHSMKTRVLSWVCHARVAVASAHVPSLLILCAGQTAKCTRGGAEPALPSCETTVDCGGNRDRMVFSRTKHAWRAPAGSLGVRSRCPWKAACRQTEIARARGKVSVVKIPFPVGHPAEPEFKVTVMVGVSGPGRSLCVPLTPGFQGIPANGNGDSAHIDNL